ncbi:hypothetical protein BN1088_1433354 [Sphingobacterium sp. PM2-P1-29]|nr:hypothetical protein BN1088_1433354 [Sphingobacterium sp. PM2-P1-29]
MMQEEPRFLVGKHVYRIDTIFGEITQAGNADNRICISELQENQHSYALMIDPTSGRLLSGKAENDAVIVTLPKTILEDGYAECTTFAENFNAQLSETLGIRLVDEAVLKELEEMSIPLPQHVLPIIEQYGYRFEIDVSLSEMRNLENPFVHVNLNLLEEKNGKYIVYLFDEGRLSSWNVKGSARFEIDQLVKIAPDDVSKVYGIPKDQLPETDKNLRSNPDFMRDRIEKGKLPIIRIVDEDFYVDTRMRELRSCSKFWKTVPLSGNFEVSVLNNKDVLDDKHVFLYDNFNRKIMDDYNKLTEVPKHAQFIVLPDIRALDPVAAGRIIHNNPYSLLDKYPLQPRMEARVVPIEKTYLLEQIKRNKEKMHEKNNKVITPAQKNRKNKGLSQ